MQTTTTKKELALRYSHLCAKEALTEAETGELVAIRDALAMDHEAILAEATRLAVEPTGKPTLTPLQRERLRKFGASFRKAVEELKRKQQLH